MSEGAQDRDGQAKSRKRKPAKRQVSAVVTYGQEMRDIFHYVTRGPDDVETEKRKRPKISEDAIRVMSEIAERVGDACIDAAERISDPTRETLYCSDLANAVRMAYLFSPEQEEMAQVVMDAREAVRQSATAEKQE